jgi:DNA-binding transcriptional ArsR family regulator
MNSETADTDASAKVDAIFGALSDVHRRYTLYYLQDRGSATIDELATVLASWLGTCEDQTVVVTPNDREQLRTELADDHLPELADTAFVRYDRETGDVSVESLPEIVETILDLSLKQQRERSGQFDGRSFDWHTGR